MKCTCFLLAIIGGALFFQDAPPSKLPDERLEIYLKRLGLDDLHVKLLEQKLENTGQGSEQNLIAAGLISHYARMLDSNRQTTTDDRDRQIAQLNRLIERFGDAASCQSRISLAHAQLGQIESRFSRWLESKRESDQTRLLLADLDQLSRAIDRLQVEIRLTVNEESNSDAQFSLDEPAESQLNRFSSAQVCEARLKYVDGWIQYYLGVAAVDGETRQRHLTAGRRAFCELLQFNPADDYSRLEAVSLDLDVFWRAQSIVGLAMTDQALDRSDQSDRLFGFLDDPRAHPGVRKRRRIRRFHSMAFVQNLDAAVRWAGSTLAAEPVSDDAIHDDLWGVMAAACCRWFDRDRKSARQLFLLSLIGLAREHRFDVIDQVIDDCGWPVDGDDFYSQWISSQRLFRRAENEGNEALYRQTRNQVSAAMEKHSADVPAADIHSAQHLLAWSHFRLRDYEPAGKLFRQVADFWQNKDDQIAAEAMWMRCRALEELSRRATVYRPQYVSAVNELKDAYPDSAFARQAGFAEFRARLDRCEFADAIEQLRGIAVDDPDYASAQFEICRRFFEQCRGSSGARLNMVEAARVVDVIDRFLASPAAEQAAMRVGANLMASEVLIRQEEPDLPAAASRLDSIEDEIGAFPATMSEVSQFHYFELMIAEQSGDDDAKLEQATWLADHSPDGQYRRIGLVHLANRAEKLLDDASDAQRPEYLQNAITLYRRIDESFEANALLDASVADVARVVNAKLAQFEQLTGDLQSADSRLERLISAFPDDANYLLQSARVKSRLQQTDQALDLWRRLAAGSRAGSQIWIEAKFHLISLIALTDEAAARKILRQTRLLVPELPEIWRGRFDQLESQFKLDAGTR